MATERKHHIIRIKGKSKDPDGGEPIDEDDIWVDVRRIDEVTITDQGDGQRITKQFAWDDGFNSREPDEERETTTLKLTDPLDPPEDPDDPEVYIPLPVIDKMSVMDADQRIIYEFANKIDPDNPTTRDVTIKRVTFAETNKDPLDDPVDADEYERNRDTVDDQQYLDVEVINSYRYNDADQRVETRLDQGDELLNQFEASPEDEDVKPVRLDPAQQIVNVQWGGATNFYWNEDTSTRGSAILDPCGVLDNQKFTLSGWFYIDRDPEDVEANSALQLVFSGAYGDSLDDWQGISIFVDTDRSTGNFMVLDVYGRWDTFRTADILVISGTPPGSPLDDPTKTRGYVHSVVGAVPGAISSALSARRWFHLFVAFDASSTASADVDDNYTTSQRMDVYINGIDTNPFRGSHPFGVDNNDNQLPSGRFAPYLLGSPATPALLPITGSEGTNGGLPYSIIRQCPPWSVPLEGFPFSVPDLLASYAPDYSVVCTGFMLWTGQAMSVASVTDFVVGGIADPKMPRNSITAAIEKYGRPQFVLDGPPTRFIKNARGLADEFRLDGKAKAFNPRPRTA